MVRATGGLDDTIQEWNPETSEGTGFKFANLSAAEFRSKIDEALTLFRSDKAAWQKLMRNGMAKDYSWTKPAAEYVELYQAVARRRS